MPLPKLNIGAGAELAAKVGFGTPGAADTAFMLTANGDGEGAVERLASDASAFGISVAVLGSGVEDVTVEAGGIPNENVLPLDKGFSETGVARLNTGGAVFGTSLFSAACLGGLSENGRFVMGFDAEKPPNEKGSELTGPFAVFGAISDSGLGAGGVAVKVNGLGDFDTTGGCTDKVDGGFVGSVTTGFGASAGAANADAANTGLVKKGAAGILGNFGGPMESSGLRPMGLSPRNALINASRFSSAFLVSSDADFDS